MHLAAEEMHRHREEVGDALLAQVLEDREVDRAGRIGEPPAHLDVLGKDDSNRAFQEFLGLQDVVGDFVDLDRVAVRLPDEAAAEHVGVQRADERRGAVQREAAGDQAVAELEQHVLRQPGGRRALDQPVDHRLNVQSFVSHRLDSTAPGTSGRRASTPLTLDLETAA